MRHPLVLVSVILVVCALGLEAQRRVPPGQRQADAVEDTMTKLEPPMVAPPGITPAQLAREGAELNELAGLIQRQIELVNQGQFPKDLPKNLKQIEKLAHKINLQLSR